MTPLRAAAGAALLAAALFAPAAAQQGPPKLLVVLVVDQMTSDYLREFDHRWKAGFATLLREGAVFERAEYPYLNTVTCAGHSTIGTGTFPRTHGMVLNGWWHRQERRGFNCMDDDGAPHVSYGAPAKSGNSAKRLLVNTLADELRAQQPAARVVSISLKPRSAIGIAGHGGDVVTWFDEGSRSFVTSTAFSDAPVPAVKAFLEAHPMDKAQPWTLVAPPGTYRYDDDVPGERPPGSWKATFPHDVKDATGFNPLLWMRTPAADEYLAAMAAHLMDALQLGQRDTTDLLAVSFSSLDLVGHAFGPRSREVEDMLARLDGTLGKFVAHLDGKVGRSRYTLALSSDHGVSPVPEQQASTRGEGGRVFTDDVRARVEAALVKHFGPAGNENGGAAPAGARPAPARYVDAVNFVYVYLAPGVFERLVAAPKAMRAVERAIEDVPGVERVLRSDQLSATAEDRVVRAAALNHVPGRSGDLIVVPRKFWVMTSRADGAAATHGTHREYDRRVPLMLFGAGVKPGRYTGEASPADIAPTLAGQAGVKLPRTEGRVLREALR